MPRPFRTLLAAAVLALPAAAQASPADGMWLVRPDRPGAMYTAMTISGGDVNYIEQVDAHTVAIGEGRWIEQGWSGNATSLRIVLADGVDTYDQTVTLRLAGPNRIEVWDEEPARRVAVMERTSCDLSLQYLEKTAPARAGCGWLMVRGYGYSGLDGECQFHSDWYEISDETAKNPMQCMFLVPAPMAG